MMATVPSRFDAPPLHTPMSGDDIRWRRWFTDLYQLVNGQVQSFPLAVIVGASPFTFQYQQGGNASILLTNGTVSLVEWSRNNINFYTIGTTTNAMYPVTNGDYIRVTYSVLPTMNIVLR